MLRDDPGQAGELLCRGLSWWRGPALEGSVLGDIGAAEAAQFEEHRLTALEMMYDAYLRTRAPRRNHRRAGGAHHRSPLRERFYDPLMVAFHRCGRE